MRHLFTLSVLLLLFLTARGQCCCGSIGVEVALPFPAMRHGLPTYLVSPEQPVHGGYSRSGDSTLTLDLRTGCGLEEHLWTVRQREGPLEMRIRLKHMGMDIDYPSIRVPFTDGDHLFDMHHIMRCLADQPPDPQRGDRLGPEAEDPTDTISCNGGPMVVQRGRGEIGWIKPLDMQHFFWTPYLDFPQPLKTSPPEHPGGEAHFQRQLHQRFSKALIERVGVRTTLTGYAMVEESGYIHEVHLNGGKYPELDAELKRVVQQSQRWTPASVLDPAVTADRPIHRYIRQGVPISFTVDPDSIWSRIPDEAMEISPEFPTPHDSIRITLKWIGGSCGRYTSRTEVLPPEPGTAIRDVVLYFDRTQGELCCDIAPQSYAHAMAPLPPGRYRLHRKNIDRSGDLAHGAEWYRVREFEVR
ncbi:MAG TPA: hypothetical protein VGE21_10200 [Flavobacteriales bacterium]